MKLAATARRPTQPGVFTTHPARTFALALLLTWTGCAQAGAGGLPVNRVVLYKNRVGYLEHVGRVQGNSAQPSRNSAISSNASSRRPLPSAKIARPWFPSRRPISVRRQHDGLTLDGGSFSVLEHETFAGEGLIDSIRPREKRLASYAVDLALNFSSNNSSEASASHASVPPAAL